MKKSLLIITVLLLCVTVFLAACESDKDSKNGSSAVESSAVSVDESKPSSSTSGNENSAPGGDSSVPGGETSDVEFDGSEYYPTPESEIVVLHSAYTEKPYFALIGRCAEGATVTGVADGETVSSESYMGWFSLRLPCEGDMVKVTLTQTVNGEAVGEPKIVNTRPTTPDASMWPMVTGGDYQFFLDKMLTDFQGLNIPSVSDISAMTSRVSNRITELRSVNPNAEIIYLIAPSAMSVYPELVPDEYKPASVTKLDMVYDGLEAAGATVIDLKALFAEHKEDDKTLYYKLDSHWADYGAYVAYQAMFEHIATKFPDAAPLSVDDFDWNPNYYEGGDLAYYLAKNASQTAALQSKLREYAYFRTFKASSVPSAITSIPRYRSETMLCYHDMMTVEKTINTNRENLPSCLVMRDSYSTQIYDIIAERMDTTHYLGMWDFTWRSSTVKAEKPDYVIYILSEWNLDSVLYN